MKKRFWSNFFMGILAIGLIAGCSNDEWEEGGNTPNPDSEDAVYMNVQVQLPVEGQEHAVKPTHLGMVITGQVQTGLKLERIMKMK